MQRRLIASTLGQSACRLAEGSALTHATGAEKKVGTAFTWTAPSNSVGKATFFGLTEWSGQLCYTHRRRLRGSVPERRPHVQSVRPQQSALSPSSYSSIH